jgi:hypothetical protein
VVLVLAAPLAAGCKAKTPVITEPLVDTFERAEIGAGWLDTSNGQFRVREGKLNVAGAVNHPLWLRKRLPRDVVVELDVMSKSEDGDIKIELFGDGESFDPDEGDYFPTGYVFVFGGWTNRVPPPAVSLSIIGKLGEHNDAVKASRQHLRAPDPAAGPLAGPVVVGRSYRWTITRKGGQIDWKIDGQPFLAWTDPSPLYGDANAYLGFNNWKTDVYFDNLKIRPGP